MSNYKFEYKTYEENKEPKGIFKPYRSFLFISNKIDKSDAKLLYNIKISHYILLSRYLMSLRSNMATIDFMCNQSLEIAKIDPNKITVEVIKGK